ncbi:hypothetical protein [Bacillus licheniformis]|uniref:hypothetical protein n=1 Tax=Bacillus licheniformis TaxID=1402 RepID=UPI00130C4D08|nr:hypothetical protein [Bacillus licheniformis]MBU8562356.1 hypothetical protein [Bacillus licheniformis]MDE1363759.1 hypothetical protein [Bacillus licheniformis]MDE1435446.1 hypothetical protein [Bacillus licheniformis]MEC1242596.1 hypothetical protein [Bacillus licheniformis]MEC1324637.1 hypothetical protein [Bacillus licheniformis]
MKQRNPGFSFQYSGDNLIKLDLFRPDQEKSEYLGTLWTVSENGTARQHFYTKFLIQTPEPHDLD